MPTVKQIRESKGITQVELAVKTFLSPAVISRLENGHPVSKSTLERVCQALGVDAKTVEGVNITSRIKRSA